MDVFELRDSVIDDYSSYVRSFITIRDERIRERVEAALAGGHLWPDPLIQLNPAFEPGEPLQQLVDEKVLHRECLRVFARKGEDGQVIEPFRLHRHQVQSIHAARAGDNYVLTTGTGSGKSLAYIVPIVDHVLRAKEQGAPPGIKAVIVYPMNALANSQLLELRKFLCRGYPDGKPPVTFDRYTGQEDHDERNRIISEPPDILLTNYVMLELVLTRPWEHKLVQAAQGLRFLVFDELHTYRGRQGSDVALLIRRVREACQADHLIHVGTSATLASGGNWDEQQREVARVASLIFGATVKPERIIGETLRRSTPAHDDNDPGFRQALSQEIAEGGPKDGLAKDFVRNPLASWVESHLGLAQEAGTGRLVRCPPRSITGDQGAAHDLATTTGADLATCERALKQTLLSGYRCKDEAGRPVFAFRVHQFLSKGESVYAAVGSESDRHITLQAQLFVPGTNREQVLLPMAFCRECGQEYYTVRRTADEQGRTVYVPRDASERFRNDDGEPGFLYLNHRSPWPSDAADVHARLPDSWLEEDSKGRLRIKSHVRDRVPQEVFLSPLAVEGEGTIRAHYLEAPFRFCLQCRVEYGSRQTSDFGKLATLGSEGRSTATTVLTLSTVRELRDTETLSPEARKLLSFTDNRQDASLQAGHFNDFVEVSLLRSALLKAIADAGAEGIRHEDLTRRVFTALGLPLELYAQNPEVEYTQKEQTQRALRESLGYNLYRDLRRGWRLTSPNLEQCGLLRIEYASLAEFCGDEKRWQRQRDKNGKEGDPIHPLLATASPAQREVACRTLLDYLRRELAISTKYLDRVEQETIHQLSNSYLIPPWSLPEDAKELESSLTCYPRSSSGHGEREAVYLSPRGGFALYLKRKTTFPDYSHSLSTNELAAIIPQLLQLLTIPGLVKRVVEPRGQDDVPGYQLDASAMVWKLGNGESAFHDLIRVPNAPDEGLQTNPFFKEFYRSDFGGLKQLEAREHTAQVPSKIREERETKFRTAQLPILYCSPTMELGVDIAELNVVNMRNVPPTPANYAQRSGRAGRSGQPAFVFTYCSSGRPHDQYFFRQPDRMVAGAVPTPRLDLSNEDLLKAHVHAIWLGLADLDLKDNLAEILDVSGEDPSLNIVDSVREKLDNATLRKRAFKRARLALHDAIMELVSSEGGDPDLWLKRVLDQLPRSFLDACERWKGLYRAALNQSKRQHRIMLDPSNPPEKRKAASRLRDEADRQLELLRETDSSNNQHSDFYSYRYFASEGFLPGYNFPRLPLSAYLPGHRRRRRSQFERDNFLTRPRFLAISEFGPRAVVYHEGSRYVINKVILPVEADEDTVKHRAVQCMACGHVQPIGDDPGPDLCPYCRQPLPPAYTNLFRMENVSTRRRDRINSDEEERLRLGYELKTGFRFAERAGALSLRTGTLQSAEGVPLAELAYGHAATIWRMNMGWRRRAKTDQLGYVLDVERGYWAKSQVVDDDPEDDMSARKERVIPYVEDRRNCLLLSPKERLSLVAMASLQAALKTAIQVHYQLEDNELAAEPLPTQNDRRTILFYEASEGGAGVLRRLLESAGDFAQVARRAIELCHFDPDTRVDLGRAPGAEEQCESACYECLLSYYNQIDHRNLSRHVAVEQLQPWATGTVLAAPGPVSRDVHLARLLNLCDSELERRWLNLVDKEGLRLPSDGQPLIEEASAKPDFLYRSEAAAIFIDGPHHDTPEQRATDEEQRESLRDLGYNPIVFHYQADWDAVLRRYPGVFGTPIVRPTESDLDLTPYVAAPSFDLDLFDQKWHPLLRALATTDGVTVDAGGDVSADGRVVGMDVAVVTKPGVTLRLVDEEADGAGAVAAALSSQGHTALRLRASDPTAIDQVLVALRG